MDDRSPKYALWKPAWYELDQPIAVGQRDRFNFFKNPPEEFLQADEYDFVFFNRLLTDANCEVRLATVLQIEHPTLGRLQQVVTDGLDYIFVRSDGTDILVNAEEEPGSSHEPGIFVTDWSIRVMLTEVSEPLAEIV